MDNVQQGIRNDVPQFARYITWQQHPSRDPRRALRALAERELTDDLVVGLGASLVSALGADIPGLREFPQSVGAGVVAPSTPAALWCRLQAAEPGPLVHAERRLRALLDEAFIVESSIDAFKYAGGRDLTGYEDGTENPTGDVADAVAFVGAGEGIVGSSFVAVQRWKHDLDIFDGFTANEQDAMIGRRRSDNEELDDAPNSAHVKRTAQENFDPEAFVLRRSMPWADSTGEGLLFVAFGKSFDAFEAQLRRMYGHDDGITDALLRFTRPLSGNYFWCPPTRAGRLDLSALAL